MALQSPFGPTGSTNPEACSRARQELIHAYFDTGFPYSKKLTRHTQCINALAFSNGDGRWLASAGDDTTVMLWDMHQENVSAPSCSFTGPRANIFTLAFSASNKYVFSGGVDDVICKFDISRYQPSPNSTFSDSAVQTDHSHRSSVRAISCHPSQDEVFLSASEDGSVILHDARVATRRSQAEGKLQQMCEFTGVQFHPRMENIFVTSDNRGKVCLRDVRMAFGPLHQRSKQGVVRTYVSTLARKTSSAYCKPDASSVTFNADGTKLAAVFLHYYPTIYSVSDDLPLAICTGRNLPDGNPVPERVKSYANCCSIKHGSFGGLDFTGQEYYTSGSDDFRGYIWKLPPTQLLEERRQAINSDDWHSKEWPHVTAFTDGHISHDKYVPAELSTPLFRLHGHKSIVNTSLIHPIYPIIMTAGIERHVVMHSPTPITPFSSDLTPTSTEIRTITPASFESQRRLLRALSGADISSLGEGLGEDGNTIALFDEIIRHEGDSDLFVSSICVAPRPSTPSSSDSDSEDIIAQESESDDEETHIMW